ncbi:MAG TPA: FAD-dependent oxidoreductase [Vicinamibacterales bacterium]|jgi:3-phenylpropionate/trans-cinnamate dioxygenase ferredoxin reductase subunit
MTDPADPSQPDFKNGIPVRDLPDGRAVAGRVGDDEAILVRRGNEIFAVGAHCTHYHGPLADGLVVGDTVRCPWHHACFSLRTGAPLRAPALDPVACWRVERVGETVFVREQMPEPAPQTSRGGRAPSSIVILGGGAAGLAAADMLRREGYDGPLTIISADDAPPSDRPNLSKDFLAGTAKEDWIPLRAPEYYTERRIDLVLESRVSTLDARQKRVTTDKGKTYEFDALLIATGAEPVRLDIPGATDAQVYYLRSFSDSRTIVERSGSAKDVVVIGASFIGLEVAASLRTRGLNVHVVAPESQPLERVMGPEVGRFIRKLHESHGVVFHLGNTVKRVEGRAVTLSDGATVEADFLVAGVGVRPALEVAERAGLKIDQGIAVDEYLETSVPGIFAAGDLARWPDPHTGDRIRVEHWVVAERQGQAAARNILGARERFEAVPFFWSQHYDIAINYVGHAERWDSVDVDGDLDKDATVRYMRGDRALAVATIGRDLVSLQAELEMETSRP